MKVYFLDVLHKKEREWADWGAIDLLSVHSDKPVPLGSIIFAHASDFFSRSGLSATDIKLITELCNEERLIVVVISGGSLNEMGTGQRKLLEETLNPKGINHLHFYKEPLPTKASLIDLEARFGTFVKHSTLEEPSFSFLYSSGEDLVVAFRIMVQAYILATTSKVIPQKLQHIREALSRVSFRRDFWTPILDSSGKLKPDLWAAKGTVQDPILYTLASSLEQNECWDPPPFSQFVVYEEHWLDKIDSDDNEPQ